MEPSPSELFLPPSFPYPIKISSIDANVSSVIERGTRLLSYSFVYFPLGSQPETRFGTWDSAVEGTLESWNFKAGDVISERRAREKPVAVVLEPCKHGMQIGGLCVLCGKDMTNSDYIGFSDASRASIQMTHSANGPTVSLEEAQRIERETAQRLLKDRKLSLIVDLDQTIVHATVDPTVGEWISEGESWEARHAQKGLTDPDDPEDQCNPNWEALKDVKKFRLGPETLGSSSRGKGRAPTAANKGVENDGCIYYIKPRPGWKEFLEDVSTKYEMHVYTMGTRAYAEEVCAAIDPEGKAFGGRLLSRDESGSLTQKSLQRLFPCDTSMVVIIDDRADVWEWSPNLIKVIPYDFFVGIGDINSTFLPKVEPLTVSTPPPSPAESNDTSPAALVPTQPPSPEEVERSEIEAKEMLSKNSETLDAQMKERPLAKRQEELLEEETVPDGRSPTPNPLPDPKAQQSVVAGSSGQEGANATTPSKAEKTPRKALLKNDDTELLRVNKILDEIHQKFFAEYDTRSTKVPSPSHSHPHRRKSISARKHGPEKPVHDVTRIIPSIRSDVLKGVHLLFSSVIPLDTRPESTEIWRVAVMFGAQCSTELTSDITHVVAAKRGTVKVDMARRRGNIKIVWVAWFTDSIALWKRQDETPYLLDDPPIAGPSTSPTLSLHQTSSDIDLDDDEDWELETNAVGGGVSLGTSGFQANQINWDDINDEVDAAMMESDDDEETSDKSGMRSGNVSEDEWTDESNSVISSVNNTPKNKRKRLRSLTPSESGINGKDPDVLRSPLSKRKKLAADRTGFSKLKVAINADDLRSGEESTIQERSEDGHSEKSDRGSPGKASSGVGSPTNENSVDNEDEDEDEEEETEEDFLAQELEEEWG